MLSYPWCAFGKWHKKDTVQDHLLLKPFPKNYLVWNRHGEIQPVESSSIEVQATPYQENPLNTLINDVFGHHGDEGITGVNDVVIDNGGEDIADERLHEASFDDGSEFNEFVRDGNEKLHESSKCTKLEFIIKLYHIKVLCRISDKAMTMILNLLRDTFGGIQLPSSFYLAKQITYKTHASIAVYVDGALRKKKKKQAAKVLRYFPLKPRLKRLYMSSKTAEHMQWHNSAPARDGLLRHPRDGQAWKDFNATHTLFAEEPRNICLGLATDGFNPFGALSSTNSVWPVFLIPYNLPPWMCMNHTLFILSMIIPGKKSPGNKIDVYLQPLIDELKDLWNDGVETFDSSSGNTFRMHAYLMWTISNFPGLEAQRSVVHLRSYQVLTFLNNNRMLKHEISNEKNPIVVGRDLDEKSSSGTSEAFSLIFRTGKPIRCVIIWTLCTLRRMCDNILYTLLNDKAKSKDNLKARKDLKEMGIRRDLWPRDNGSYHSSLFSLTRDTKKLFLSALKNVVLPDGYSSNISRCVDEGQKKIFGLKSHDCHILLEELLPIAIRHLLSDHVTAVLVEFGSFFKILCGKSLSTSKLDKLQQRIVIVFCQLEMLFPLSFFTVMVHLTVHLVEEAKLGGPVHYRYMYPIERELGHLKSHVRNRAQAEASIAEGYLAEECLTFYSRYFEDIETRFNRPRRVCDDPLDRGCSESCLFPTVGKAGSSGTFFTLSEKQKLQAHRYVLLNCQAVKDYVNEFREYIIRSSKGRRPNSTDIEKRVFKDFVSWFEKRIMNPDIIEQLSTDIKFLARGPLSNATRYSAYKINGCTFRTVAREEGLRTQNSGVYLTSSTPCVASRVDRNLRQGDVPYYGKLEDIIELSYYGPIHTGEHEEDEPYILASQASMVYYVNDVVNKGWSIVVHLKPRDLYEMGYEIEEAADEDEPHQEQALDQFFGNSDEYMQLATNQLIDDVVD
ncbi:uncharacterized protein [Arachis hypogaea]|uniref:uncharacterized protein n=1 Tax=Arachis hypogaea TaxID=3818 RepID=UPI000DECAAF5|nr:uncharacterized protein LOC112794834 [Arachis hypogaea]